MTFFFHIYNSDDTENYYSFLKTLILRMSMIRKYTYRILQTNPLHRITSLTCISTLKATLCLIPIWLLYFQWRLFMVPRAPMTSTADC